MLHTVKIMTTIDHSHQLHSELSADKPAAQAEGIVWVTPASPAADTAPMATLLEFFAQLDADSRPRLSAGEVVRWVEDERNVWDAARACRSISRAACLS